MLQRNWKIPLKFNKPEEVLRTKLYCVIINESNILRKRNSKEVYRLLYSSKIEVY